MSVKITGKYLGSKKCEITHVDSGTVITTAAPKDNNGDGSSFSPTDLFASSLGSCMVTIMSIVAERRQIDLTGCTYEVIKNMHPNPRRVGLLQIQINFPNSVKERDKQLLEKAAMACPVHKSLHPDIEVNVKFN